MNKKTKKNMCELYLNTLTKDMFIQNQGFNLVTIWEHEWDEFVKNKKTILFDVKGILPRECAHGRL